MFSWIAHFIERYPFLHRAALAVWRSFPPRLAGFLKGMLARNWLVGAVAVMLDESVSPAEVLIVEHSYRPRGAWGLPGGALESIPGDPRAPREEASPDDAIEAALRREVWEELGIQVAEVRFLRVDAIPYIVEEPGPYRLDFYFKCMPEGGFEALRKTLAGGGATGSSPEILRMRLVPLNELADYDIFSSDARFLRDDLPRLIPELLDGQPRLPSDLVQDSHRGSQGRAATAES